MDLIKFRAESPELSSFLYKEEAETAKSFVEFFFLKIRNLNTRESYMFAIKRFMQWCDLRNLRLMSIEPLHIASYIEEHDASEPTVKQHLSAIKMLYDHLVTSQIIKTSPASSVKGPRYVVKKGKTPVLSQADAKKLLSSIDNETVIGARDKALIALMIYSFARVSAVLKMQVKDYYQNGRKHWIRLHEKGGRFHEVPVHHKAEEYLESYLSLSGIKDDKNSWLFRSTIGRSQNLNQGVLSRYNAFQMVKRRAKRAGISDKISCHSFRATGITAYLSHGGNIENAQAIAAHESPRTTKLYDRRSDEISLDEIERIII